MDVDRSIGALKEILENWDGVVDEILDSLMGDFVGMEQERIFSGANADGSMIEPEYTPFTKRVKRSKGQPADRVTLFDTGRFYDSMFAERSGDVVLFDATDNKRDKLVRKYGDGFFGLSDTQIDEARGRVNEMMSEYILSRMG
jgi:hypothetical protein